MLPRLTVRTYRTLRKVVTPLARGCAGRIKGLAAQVNEAAPPALATASLVTTPSWHPVTSDAEHAAILAAFEETARLGHVPADALIGRLHACHCDRLADDRQRLVALEQELEALLVRLDARFPVPPPPEPEKPQSPRGRRFGPISADLRAKSGSTTRH